MWYLISIALVVILSGCGRLDSPLNKKTYTVTWSDGKKEMTWKTHDKPGYNRASWEFRTIEGKIVSVAGTFYVEEQ